MCWDPEMAETTHRRRMRRAYMYPTEPTVPHHYPYTNYPDSQLQKDIPVQTGSAGAGSVEEVHICPAWPGQHPRGQMVNPQMGT